jgi:tetrahydromethanopterin S-methyltransferase subunit B
VDPDQKNAKLVTYFMSMNLVAAALGFAAVILFGAFTGLMIFALLILILPLGFEYFYLKRETDKQGS